ncbi:MAG: aminoacetone oxidase family FAD-binding enzyme, partial [Lachnospiraceae bacterium]|nr:aminoacetone oxidase family FAD-binding enzyme [Lachnospiraceae bacterium]
VALIEANDLPGKKLLATGNGKCNFTNNLQTNGCYRGENPEVAMQLLERFDVACILGFFGRLGILPRQREGYWYPNSEQAASVQGAFAIRLAELKVPIYVNTHVDAVCKGKTGHSHKGEDFYITARKRVKLTKGTGKKSGKKPGKPVFSESTTIGFRAKYLVLATGGCAGNISGADGSGYVLASGFGHRIIPPVPALVQLRSGKKALEALSGVRVRASVLLCIEPGKRNDHPLGGGDLKHGENSLKYRERGEVLFTDYGISGIPVMQVSRFAAREFAKGEGSGKIRLFLDFFPDIPEEELTRMLTERFATFPARPAPQALIGLLPEKLMAVLLLEAGYLGEGFVPIQRLSSEMKHFCLEICGTNDFVNAQATAGGVDLAELSAFSLESGLVDNLYVTGELADIDGTCGGYNLQWAWMSGFAAAEGILTKMGRQKRETGR